MKINDKLMPVLRQAVEATFKHGDWLDFAMYTGCKDIKKNQGLWNALSFGNSSYGAYVFDALENVFLKNGDALDILLKMKVIEKWIERNEPDIFHELYESNNYVPPLRPKNISPSETVLKALEEADKSCNSSDPQSAIDRLHTAFKGYLEQVCCKLHIPYAEKSPVKGLYALIHRNISKANNQENDENIKNILQSFGGAVESLDTIRSTKSLSHPRGLLGKDEAVLFINVIRTLFHYLDAKMK